MTGPRVDDIPNRCESSGQSRWPTPAAASWRSPLDPGRRAMALRVARDVAARVTDPGRLATALAASTRQTLFPQTLDRRTYGVADGDAGLAVACGYFDACLPGEGWDEVGHGFLAAATAATAATAAAESAPVGLFGGLSGLAFAARSLSRDGARYQRMLAALDGMLAPDAAALGEFLCSSREPGPVSAFDLISGATGVAAYLLTHDADEGLPGLLRGLTALTENRAETPPGAGVPRWMTPASLLADESMRRRYPLGNLNCGLAHGIPGPLAVLALALRAGVEVPGQAEAVRRAADWLVAHQVTDEWGISWPAAVPVPAPDGARPSRPVDRPGPTRSAWCYGAPGVARALWLAGEALDDGRVRETAIETMRAVLRRPVRRRGIPSPTFCHGVAGLLQIVLRFHHDSGLFHQGVAELVDELLAAYRPDRPLGYVSYESYDPDADPVDRAGLLDGAPGVALVLLAAATDTEPTWDRLFLLS